MAGPWRMDDRTEKGQEETVPSSGDSMRRAARDVEMEYAGTGHSGHRERVPGGNLQRKPSVLGCPRVFSSWNYSH